MTRARRVISVALWPVLVGMGCSDTPTGDRAAPMSTAVPGGAAPVSEPATVTRIAALADPVTSITAGTADEILISEISGRIWRYVGVTAPGAAPAQGGRLELVLDLSARTAREAPAGGLLGLAVSTSGGRLIVDRTTPERKLEVTSYRYEPTGSIDPASERVLASIDHPYVHKGGAIVPTPDGGVLVSIGALRSPEPLGDQNPDGVIVRFGPDAVEGDATIPPFTESADVVARGFRNPWRVTLDASTGDLWIGDVGESTAEEVNRIRRVAWTERDGDPLNFGWPYREGTTSFLDSPPADLELEGPFFEYPHGDGRCAIVGGVVYRGPQIGAMQGNYVFGDVCDTRLQALTLDDETIEMPTGVELPEPPNSIGTDRAGRLYVAGSKGSVFRIDPPLESTTPVSDPVCGIAESLQAMQGLERAAPAEVRIAMEDLRDALEADAERLPEELQWAGSYLAESIDTLIEIAREAGWDIEDPALRRAVRSVRAERGAYSSWLRAVNDFVDAASRCAS